MDTKTVVGKEYDEKMALLPVARYLQLAWGRKHLIQVEGRPGLWLSGQTEGALRVRVACVDGKWREKTVFPALVVNQLIRTIVSEL